jgi:hypothetical protein
MCGLGLDVLNIEVNVLEFNYSPLKPLSVKVLKKNNKLWQLDSGTLQ